MRLSAKELHVGRILGAVDRALSCSSESTLTLCSRLVRTQYAALSYVAGETSQTEVCNKSLNAPSLKFVTPRATWLTKSGIPGFTSPGTFRLRSFYSLDGLLLRQFAHLVSCGHHQWGSKSDSTSTCVLGCVGKPPQERPESLTPLNMPAESAEAETSTSFASIPLSPTWVARVESWCVTHLSSSEEKRGRRAQPHPDLKMIQAD